MQSKQSQSIFQSPTFIFVMVLVLVVLAFLCIQGDKEPNQEAGGAHKGHAEEGEKKKKKKNKTKKPKEEVAKKIVEEQEQSDLTEPEIVVAPKKQEKKQEQPKAKASAKQNKKAAEAAKPKEQVKEKPKEIPEPVKEEPIVQPVVVQKDFNDSYDSGDSFEMVKDKKKQHTSKPQSGAKQVDHGSAFGGKTSKGFMVAGPIQQTANKVDHKPKYEQVNHASAVADCDYGVSRNEFSQGSKFETYTHVCSSAVAYQRCQAKLSQHELATKVNEKTQVITELENGAGRYSADLVNRIEHALKCKIPRGRAEAASVKKSGKK